MAGLYAAFGKQATRLKDALDAKRGELEKMQAAATKLREKALPPPSYSLDDLDWLQEAHALSVDLEPVFQATLSAAILDMALEHSKLGAGVSWEIYNAQAAEYARTYSPVLIKQITDSTRQQVGQKIGRWIESGDSFPALVDEVWKLVPANPFPNMRDRAQVIAATETTRVYAETQRMALSAAGLKRWRWRTANDERRCPWCSALGNADGGEGAVGDVTTGLFTDPLTGDKVSMPRHPACRCWAVADTTELEQLAGMSPEESPPTKAEVTAAVEPATAAAEPAPKGPPPVFQTTKEAEKWGRDNLGVPNVRYGKLPPDTANAINQAFQEHFERYPRLRERIEFVGSNQERSRLLKVTLRPRAEAAADKYLELWRKINTRATVAEELAAKEKYVAKWLNKYTPKTPSNNWGLSIPIGGEPLPGITFNERLPITQESLARNIATQFHPAGATEVRSVIDHELGHQLDDLLKLRQDDTITKMYMDLARRPGGIKNALSDYARKSPSEFIAESWAEYVNSPNPRPTAKAVGEYLVKRYKELYP